MLPVGWMVGVGTGVGVEVAVGVGSGVAVGVGVGVGIIAAHPAETMTTARSKEQIIPFTLARPR